MRIDYGSKGRGLFATQDIPPELCFTMLAPCTWTTECWTIVIIMLYVDHYYLFNTSGGNKLVALGYGSLFNHSNRPNVDYRVDTQENQILYKSGYKMIKKDEELCISYVELERSYGSKMPIV